jgi:Co/Zn/Cd efflux system component
MFTTCTSGPLTAGIEAASVHVGIEQGASPDPVLLSVKEFLSRYYKVAHSTIQCERPWLTE